VRFQFIEKLGDITVSILFVFCFISLLCSSGYSAEVTPEDISDIILDPGQGDVSTYDLNQDGQVDVADVVLATTILPQVSFTSSTLIVNEGQGIIDCEVKTDSTFTGVLQYEIGGNAIAGEDYSPLTGNVQVNAGSGMISISLLDNLQVESTKTIILSLKPSTLNPSTYSLGPKNSATMILEDNDASWLGHLVRGDLMLPFELIISQMGEQVQATLESDGVAAFPAGSWPVTVQTTIDSFIATIGPITMEQSVSLLNENFLRSIILSSNPTTNQEDVLELSSTIEGSVLEEYVFSETASQHLNRVGDNAVEGRFVLVRGPLGLPQIESELVPVQ